MGGVVKAVGGVVKGAVNAVTSVAGSVVKAGINVVAGAARSLAAPLAVLSPGLYRAIDSKLTGVQKFANGVVDGATSFVKGLAGAAVDLALAPTQIAANILDGAWKALGGAEPPTGEPQAQAAGKKPVTGGAGAAPPKSTTIAFTPPFTGTPRDVKTLSDLARYGSMDDAIQAIRELGALAKAGVKEALAMLLEIAPATGFRRGDSVVCAALSMLKDVPGPEAKAALKAFADSPNNEPEMRDLARRALG